MPTDLGYLNPRDKTYVATQGPDVLTTRTVGANRVQLKDGTVVDMLRYFTDADIATGASDTSVIANADASVRIVGFAYCIMCDANTSVQFRSNSADIGLKHYCAANGGINRPYTGQPLFACEPGQALAINTSGGNTNLDIHYALVPISTDIL